MLIIRINFWVGILCKTMCYFMPQKTTFVLPKYFAARIMVKIGIYSTLMIPGIIHAIILLLILKTPTTYYIRAKDVFLNQMTVGKHGIVFSDKSIMEKAVLFFSRQSARILGD